jgi:NAD(P)H-flavin reductase/hemoglobin-like flavoprotein
VPAGPHLPVPAGPQIPVPVRPGIVVPGATGPVGPVIPPLGRPQHGGPDPQQPWPYPPAGGTHGAHHPGAHHPGAVPGDPLVHVPPVARPQTGGPIDGPDPADDVALHHLHEVLLTSLTLSGGIDEVAGRLRQALLLAHPRLMAAVPGTEVTHREQLAQALTWLVDNLEHPPVLAAGCGQLGAALREFGVQPQQLQLTGAALAEAMRAGMANGWRQEYDSAWRSTWHHVHEWMIHGAEAARWTPMRWTAVVADHDRRRPDLAVLRLRPYLPMPFQPGQYARVEVAEQPGVWRPYSLAGAPRVDNVLELHVRAKGQTGVSGALVHRVRSGDRIRLSRAEGNLVLPPRPDRDLLFIAGDTGVAPLKALLIEVARTADPRSVVLFWGARTLRDLYDINEVEAVARACRRATVVPVISEGPAGPYASGLVTDAVAAYGEWSQHEVFLAGPPLMLTATRAVLRGLGLADERIHHDPTDVDRPAR